MCEVCLPHQNTHSTRAMHAPMQAPAPSEDSHPQVQGTDHPHSVLIHPSLLFIQVALLYLTSNPNLKPCCNPLAAQSSLSILSMASHSLLFPKELCAHGSSWPMLSVRLLHCHKHSFPFLGKSVYLISEIKSAKGPPSNPEFVQHPLACFFPCLQGPCIGDGPTLGFRPSKLYPTE